MLSFLLFGPGPAQDQLESVLEVLHRQMEQYRDQPQHLEKIAYQQRLLKKTLSTSGPSLELSPLCVDAPRVLALTPRMGWRGLLFCLQPIAEKVARARVLHGNRTPPDCLLTVAILSGVTRPSLPLACWCMLSVPLGDCSDTQGVSCLMSSLAQLFPLIRVQLT